MRHLVLSALAVAALLTPAIQADDLDNYVSSLSTRVSNLDRSTATLMDDLVNLFLQRSFWTSNIQTKSDVTALYDALEDFRAALASLSGECRRTANDRNLESYYSTCNSWVRTVEDACDRAANQLTDRAYRTMYDKIVAYKRSLSGDMSTIKRCVDDLVSYLRRPPPPPPPPPPPAAPAVPFALEDVTTEFLRNDGKLAFEGPFVQANFKVVDVAGTNSIMKVDLYIDNFSIQNYATMGQGCNEVNFTDPRQPKTFNFNVQRPKAGKTAYIQVTHSNGKTYKLELCTNPHWKP